MARSDIAVSSESRAKVCRLKDAERLRDVRAETPEEARAVVAPHPVQLVADRPLHLHLVLGAALNRSIAFPGPLPSNRAERSECCFDRRAWPT